MVKWGETVEKLAMKSSFLFQRTDFVQYDSLNPANSEADSQNQPLLRKEQLEGLRSMNSLGKKY